MVKGGTPWPHPRWSKVTSDDVFSHTRPSTRKVRGCPVFMQVPRLTLRVHEPPLNICYLVHGSKLYFGATTLSPSDFFNTPDRRQNSARLGVLKFGTDMVLIMVVTMETWCTHLHSPGESPGDSPIWYSLISATSCHYTVRAICKPIHTCTPPFWTSYMQTHPHLHTTILDIVMLQLYYRKMVKMLHVWTTEYWFGHR